MTAASPHHDLIVFGATSFVGKILTRHIFEQFGTHGDLNWAAAGRSLARLEELRKSLGSQAAKLALVVADATDEAALRKMCLGTRAVVSTVGPYALYGKKFATQREAMDEVIDWLTFYNHRRLHSTLGYASPMRFEENWRAGQAKKAA